MDVLVSSVLAEVLGKKFQSFRVYDNIENKPILEFNPVSKKEGNIHFDFDEIRRKLVKDASERLGLISMSAEFYGSTEEDLATINLKKMKSHLENEFGPWFVKIAEKSNIWVDTNVLISRSIDSVVFGPKKSFDEGASIRVIVPRFVILELERLANQEKKRWRKKPISEKGFATPGRFFMAFQNLRNWKSSRIASIANPLNIRDILYFPSKAGELTMDALIRWEISRDTRKKRFLTRDFVSALAANGEDIASIYTHPEKTVLDQLDGLTSTKIAELLYEIATDIGEITLKWSDKNMLLKGIWSEKSWSDLWSQRKLLVSL